MPVYGSNYKRSDYAPIPVAGVNKIEERFTQKSVCDADIVMVALVVLAILLALSK